MRAPSLHSTVSPESTAELFRSSCRDESQRRVGIEIERIAVWPDGHSLTYESRGDRIGAAELLDLLSLRHGWPRVDNGSGRPVGVASCCGKVSLEPGSQLELSTQTTSNLLSLRETARCFEKDVDAVTREHGLSWIGCGVSPFSTVDDVDLISLPRYHIMDRYLSARDRLGTSMMRLTSSVQINLDYVSEQEAIDMLRAGLALTPLSYALFGNSPWFRGAPSGYLSYRGQIWRNTDSLRAGILERAFRDDFSFETYVNYVWSIPLMFVQDQNSHFLSGEGLALAQLKNGKLPGVFADAVNEMHAIRQIFTEARLKPGYIEIRSIDGQRTPMRYAAAAFWLGVLYSNQARKLTLSQLGRIPAVDRDQLWHDALRVGLRAHHGKTMLLEVARELLLECRKTLKERRLGEEALLAPLEEMVKEGLNPAEVLLKKFGDGRLRISDLFNYLSQ